MLHCLQDLYDIPLTPAVNKDNRLAVTGFIGNSPHFADLEVRVVCASQGSLTEATSVFLQKSRPKTSFEVDGIDGGITLSVL